MARKIIGLFFCIAPFFHGLFAPIEVALATALLLVAFLFHYDRTKQPFTRWEFALLGVVGLYWTSISYAPEWKDAAIEALKISALVMVYGITKAMTWTEKRRLLQLWIRTNTVVVLVGVLFTMYRDGRLQSVVEYANVLAIVLLVTASASMMIYLNEQSKVALFHFTIQLMGILLTQTRAVWILWLLVMLALIILYKPRKFSAILIAHLIAYGLASLVKGSLTFFKQHANEWSTQTSELQARWMYWKDAWKLMQEHPWFGVGGGGWSHLQFRVQDTYWVKYVHNGYLQIILDIGMVGLILSAAAVIVIVVRQVKNRSQLTAEHRSWLGWLVVVSAALFVHIGFDFDLNFAMFTAAIGFLLGFASPALAAHRDALK